VKQQSWGGRWVTLPAITLLSVVGAVECEAQRYEVRDSAGVAVASIGPASLGVARSWTVSPEPVLTIGQLEGEEPYLFTQVWDALRTPDHRLVVVEGRAYDIRVFSPDGQHQVTFGRHGGGPEEFGGPPWIVLAPPDTLVVWDPGHFRLTRYDLSGGLLSQVTILPTLDSLGVQPLTNGLVWQTAGDGTLLWTGRQRGWAMREGLRNRTNRVLLVREAGAEVHDFDPQAAEQVYYVRRDDGGLSGILNPFAPHSALALGPAPDRVAISDSETWEIRIFDGDGALRKIWRGDFPRESVTRAMVEQARESATSWALRLRLTRKQAERAFDRLSIADSVPAIGRLTWDKSDNLWVGRRTGTVWQVGDYDVLDGQGRWLTTVDMPDGVGRIFEIGEDYLLATGIDQYDVQYLNMYRLEKPGG
jgi:hypothetical protein